MPKIFQYLNYIIRFYTNDHLPVHVHVQKQDREIKVEFNISGDNLTLLFKKVKGKTPLTENEANEVAVFLKSFHKEIIDKWQTVFIYQKKVKCEIINKKNEKMIVSISSAKYLYDFNIAVSFTNGKTKAVDFLPLFQKYVKGENLIYFSPLEFKKFIVENGNIYWGKNEDVIFPANLLLKGKEQKIAEEILYII